MIGLVSSLQVRIECERNLRSKLPAALPAFGLLARTAVRWVEDPSSTRIAAHEGDADLKDLPILVAAIDAGCSALLTFNTKDFHPPAGDLVVETPGAFVRRLRELLTQGYGEPG